MKVPRQALDNFFMSGRMMSGSKIAAEGHVCVWNANIFTRELGKVWFGDLDLTSDVQRLMSFAADLGQTLHILRERDGRFDHENDPVWDAAVATVTADELVLSHATPT